MNLGRTLALLAQARKNQGELKVDEAVDILGIPKDQLGALVAELVVSGAPPFLPEDLLEVDLDGDWLIFDVHPAIPDRTAFSPTEAAVAIGALRSLRQGSKGALADACDTAEKCILQGQSPDLPARTGTLAWAHDRPVNAEILDAITLAVQDCKVTLLDYYSASQDKRSKREVHPNAVVSHQGRWYLGAFLPNGEHRHFRVDRIASATVTDQTFEPAASQGYRRDVLFDAPMQLVEAVVWVDGPLPTPIWSEPTEHPKEYRLREVTWPVLLRRLMALEGDWEVRGPADFRAMVAEWCSRMLK